MVILLLIKRRKTMIPTIGRASDDLGISSMNNILKNISDMRDALTEKLMKVSVTEQVEASQSGMGIVVDEYA
jgi:hypothetical protein